ncbi:pseudouridine synthase [uncultured Mesonia sp.]|uniref:pseudouridine synthase n=1 Tax=uncultured Mesonia sp. TaxID=399731 RepID=UPI00374EA61D
MTKRQGKKKTKKEYGVPKPHKKPATKKVAVDKQVKNPDAKMRLNKYIANSGICSRRDADIYIKAGNVRVNGEVVTEMGYKVQPDDEVRFDGRRITPERKEYVLLNKPSGFYVTGSLERSNRTVMDLVANASKSKLSPVGKLETSAMGLLLFTNDGTLAMNLANPKKGIRQIYDVELNRNLDLSDLKKIEEGIVLEDGKVHVNAISYVENQSKRNVGLEIHSTKPHIVQRMFKKLNYEVVRLDRVVFGGLTKKDLPRGHYRHLNKQEVINLGMI